MQDRAALEAIALQEDCGIDVITDGEVRRKFWFDPLTESLGGLQPGGSGAGAVHARRRAAAEPPPLLPAVTDKLSLRQNLPLREYSFLRAHTDTTR